MAKEEAKKVKSYDELATYAETMQAQAGYWKNQADGLYKKLVELSDFSMFKRLDYLLEVIKNDSKFPKEFVANCTEEFVQAMTPPVNSEEKTKEEE